MKKNHPFVARNRIRLASGLFALAVGASVHAETPESWWVDVINDRVPNVREELARGTDPNIVDNEGLPTLMLAIRSGAWGVYDALVAHRRVDINAENKHGETALMYLALLGETDRASALIKRGAEVNRLGWTPLHYAASRGHTDTARMLVRQGALVHAPAPDGTTPLMMAAFSGNRDTVQLLLDQGADATAINLNKHTAADWARERGHTRLAEELQAVAERTLAQREGRASAPAPATVTPSKRESSGSGSKYFDLDRFERQD
ncbi:MAG TPA: ankyrin repeat domain-containing protein [Burkholderiaceae bacterium]|nr:ankyrin repeat domain-containing protein [Burkholderiaceae bacterium]